MTMRKRCMCFLRRSAIACATFAAGAARADLFATGGSPLSGHYPALMRFADNGAALGLYPAANPPHSEAMHSVTRGPDGSLYFLTQELSFSALHKATLTGGGSVQSLSVTPPAGEQFEQAGGLAFAPDGGLHVSWNVVTTNGSTGVTTTKARVARYQAGALSTVVALTSTAGLRFQDVEFDAAGALYVGIATNGIRKVNADGQTPYTIPTSYTGNFKFGPDGRLYVPSGAAGVLRYDPATGAPLGAFVAPGAGGLTDASFVEFGADGVLYVNDRNATTILKYDAATGAPLGTFADYEIDGFFGPPQGPTDMAFATVPEPAAAPVLALATAAVIAFRRRRTAPQNPRRSYHRQR